MAVTYEKKIRAGMLKQSDVKAATAEKGQTVPNSMLTGEGVANPQLQEMMRARVQEQFMLNQNAAAEAEADKYAASVKGAGTIAEVKEKLGQSMGADFSNISIHTGAQAEQNADAIGAQAYTSGSDVYLGGKFSAETAAHELVHTVQQGQVESAAPTTAAVEGGVQMKIDTLKQKNKMAKKKEKMNASLASMSPEAIARITSGKGGFFEKIKYNRAMKFLNGTEGRELNPENMAAIVNSGQAGKQMMMDRVTSGMTATLQSKYATQRRGDTSPYSLTGDEHLKFMAKLQNDAFRTGSGVGAVKEHGILSAMFAKDAVSGNESHLLNKRGIADMPDSDVMPSELRHREDVEAASRANGDDFLNAFSGSMATRGGDLQQLNQQILGSFTQALPDVMGTDTEMSKAMVAQAAALRGVMSAAIKSDPISKGNPMGTSSVHAGMKTLNDGLLGNRYGNSPISDTFRNAMFPAPAPAPAPTQQNGNPQDIPRYKQLAEQLRNNPEAEYDPTADYDIDTRKAYAYNGILKHRGVEGDEEILRTYVGQMAALNEEAERASQPQAAPASKKKWWQFWK